MSVEQQLKQELAALRHELRRVRDSLESSAFQPCPFCHGRGNVKSMETISLEVLREFEKHLMQNRRKKARIVSNTKLKAFLYENYRKTLTQMGRQAGARVVLSEDPNLGLDEFRVEIAQ